MKKKTCTAVSKKGDDEIPFSQFFTIAFLALIAAGLIAQAIERLGVSKSWATNTFLILWVVLSVLALSNHKVIFPSKR